MKRRYFIGMLSRLGLATLAACGGKVVFDGEPGGGYGSYGSTGTYGGQYGGYGAMNDRTRGDYGLYGPAEPSREGEITLESIERTNG